MTVKNKIPHIHVHDVVIFREGYHEGLYEGIVTMITEKGVHIRVQNETVFKRWVFIKEIKHTEDS
jgi:hypothetical protein